MAARSLQPAPASHSWQHWLLNHAAQLTAASNLYQLPVSARAPMGISLWAAADCRQELKQGPFDARHLTEGLLRELVQHAQSSRRRPVPWLSWQLPHDLMDSADVTEMMYFLGRRFQLGDVPDYHYSVTFRAAELTPDRAALFRGLGFNHLSLQLNTDTEVDSDILPRACTLARDFHYRELQLCLQQPFARLPRRLLQTADRALPASISFSADCAVQKSGNANFVRLFSALRDRGYRVLGNDCFVRPHTPLARAQSQQCLRLTQHGYNSHNVSDVLGLGPGNTSGWGHARYRNPVQLASYLRAAFSDAGRAPFSGHPLKPLLDQLLCYHRLDLDYFRQRYRWNPRPVIERLWRPLQRARAPLYRIQARQLDLTASGVLQLNTLCGALVDCLGADLTALPDPTAVGQ